MVGAFQKPSSGREPKPIHSIPYSVAQPLDKGYKNYYSIIQGINMERDSISRIEIGTRFVSDFELKIFAEVLGVSVNWLLGIDE